MLTIRNGPRAGMKFSDLDSYLEDEALRQSQCEHLKTRSAKCISGLKTKTPHLTTATVCCDCKKILESKRVPFDNSITRSET